MGYLLVNADILREKGIENFEKMPDGRGITDFSMLRVLGSIPYVEIVSTAEEMLAKIKEEEESGLYDNKEVPNDPESESTQPQSNEGSETPLDPPSVQQPAEGEEQIEEAAPESSPSTEEQQNSNQDVVAENKEHVENKTEQTKEGGKE